MATETLTNEYGVVYKNNMVQCCRCTKWRECIDPQNEEELICNECAKVYCIEHAFLFGEPRQNRPDDDEEDRAMNMIIHDRCPECQAEDAYADWVCSAEGVYQMGMYGC